MGSNLDEAAKLCERAVALRPARRAYYLDTLAGIYLKQGEPKEAVATFELALAATTDRQGSLRAELERRLAAARALLKK
jgi:tetratricopeptide (TPR) repeat protein